MAEFDKAIKVVLEHEGGLVDDKDDVGGITNYGISLTYLEREELNDELMHEVDFNKNNYIDAEDIRHLKPEIATHIYKSLWWNKFGYYLIEDQCIATMVFDIAINIGPSRCHRILQKSINHFIDNKISEDGLIGPITIKNANDIDASALLSVLRTMIADFYRDKVRENQVKAKYLEGWLNRIYK